jgi:hypothetical protein
MAPDSVTGTLTINTLRRTDMTTHALPQGTVDNAAAAALMTPKVEPAPTPLTLDEFLSSIPDSRILQAAAFAIYNNVSSRIAYIALGIASKMAATERAASTEPLGMQDVLKELEEDAERARVMDLMGLEYTDRATTIGKLLRVRQDMHELIEQHWQGFQGRSLDVELARTTQPRAVNPRDVDALFQHFDGELDKNSITHGLNARARTDAERNAERLHLANMIITGIDVADEGTELDAADLQRVYERVRGALMQFETDCLTGKADGHGVQAHPQGAGRDARATPVQPRPGRAVRHEAGGAGERQEPGGSRRAVHEGAGRLHRPAPALTTSGR